MLRLRTEDEYETAAAGGVRRLFTLGQYGFEDTMDDDDVFHHFIRERPEEGEAGEEARSYEIDRETMYEFMARYLAGNYELEEYELEQSPSHMGLLDVLEIATARSRAGESEFSWDAFDQVESEVIDDAVDFEEEEDEEEGEDDEEGRTP